MQDIQHSTQMIVYPVSPAALVMTRISWLQEKKKAEADKQKELDALFAVAIKQPKVPAGG